MRALLFAIFLIFGFNLYAESHILVSIAPQKYLVNRIAKNTATVEIIVPPAASPHSYEPTPHQIVKIKNGEIWFRLGESFEKPLLPILKHVLIVDQREGIDLIPAGCSHCCKDACDSHIWLSPENLKIMSFQIYEVLSKKYPEHEDFYNKNLTHLLEDLDTLDCEIEALFLQRKPRIILVSHPAFGYFAKEYGIRQISIEMEGKEPSAKYLTDIFRLAREEKVTTVFLQKQYNYKAGKKIAADLHAKIVFLDPYAENVIENLKIIGEAFSNA